MAVWRGVRLDLRNEYKVGQTVTWWGFSSCTASLAVLESEVFLGQEGKRTIFHIKCFNGKKIRLHSSIEDEDEILLLPGSQFIVNGHLQPSKKDPDLIIIELEQIEPPFSLLQEPSPGMKSPEPGEFCLFYLKIKIKRRNTFITETGQLEIRLFISQYFIPI